LVLCVAAATSVIAHKLRAPLILSYLLAGLIIGPYIPLPLLADGGRVELLAEFGVILVMFCVGLEFRFKRLAQIIPTSGLTATIQISLMYMLGYSLGRMLEWSNLESIFLGASLCISSTMVVSKALASEDIQSETKDYIFGILVLQDLAAVIILAALTALAAGTGLQLNELALTFGKLGIVLVVMIVVGLLFVPRFIRLVKSFDSTESLVIAATGICFGLAVFAEHFGYSVALGAFMAGLLVSESGIGHEVEKTLAATRDIFAAVFFVAIGMSVNPILALDNFGLSLIVFLLVVVGQFVCILTASLISGVNLKKSATAAIALGQIGEFAFIMSAIGMNAGIIKQPLQPILVTVAVLSAFTTPFFLARADSIIAHVDHYLPNRMRILFTFYESWLEKFKTSLVLQEDQSKSRKIFIVLVIDFLAAMAIAMVISHFKTYIDYFARTILDSPFWLYFFPTAIFLLCVVPIYYGMIRNLIAFQDMIASVVFNRKTERSAFVFFKFVTNSFLLAVASVPVLIAISSIFNFFYAIVTVVVIVSLCQVFLWRQAGKFESDVRSGSRIFLEFLENLTEDEIPKTLAGEDLLGINEIVNFKIEPGSPAVGKSLADLDLRARTGATVISILRKGKDVILPKGSEIFEVGDVLCIAGANQATSAAARILKESV
jgi:CPA2 family monovalent cation:H+ antiporter-2